MSTPCWDLLDEFEEVAVVVFEGGDELKDEHEARREMSKRTKTKSR